jgi:hypothetical protein
VLVVITKGKRSPDDMKTNETAHHPANAERHVRLVAAWLARLAAHEALDAEAIVIHDSFGSPCVTNRARAMAAPHYDAATYYAESALLTTQSIDCPARQLSLENDTEGDAWDVAR